MRSDTFSQSYIELVYKILSASKKPLEIAGEKERVLQETRYYGQKLEETYEEYFDHYPSLKKELLSNLLELKVGAFFEYKLDLFHPEFKRLEDLKSEIQTLITELQNDFPESTKEWLPKEKDKIINCYRYLSTDNILQIIDFLNCHLKNLKEKREVCIQEKRNLSNTGKEAQNTQESDKEARIREEREAKRKASADAKTKALEEYKKQMKVRKK